MAWVQNTYADAKDFINERVVLQMDNTIYLDRPRAAPLLAFLANHSGNQRTYKNMEFHYLTKRSRPPYIPLAVAYDNTGAPNVLKVAHDDGVWFEINGIIFFLGIQCMVASVTKGSGTDPDVVHVLPWPATQSMPATAPLATNIILSYAIFGSKSDAPLGNYHDTVDNFNYMEQAMRGLSMSKLMLKTEVYGDDPRRQEHELALEAFKTDREMKFLFSKRYFDDSQKDDPDVGLVYNMGGMDEIITEKVLDFNGATLDLGLLLASVPDWEEFADPEDWIFYAPGSFFAILQLAAMEKQWYDTTDNSFGYAVKKWDTSFGSFPLVHARMLDHLPVPTMYLLNKSEIKLVNLEGEDDLNGSPRLYLNAQLPNQPNKIHDFFRGICGIQRGWGKKHIKITNWDITP